MGMTVAHGEATITNPGGHRPEFVVAGAKNSDLTPEERLVFMSTALFSRPTETMSLTNTRSALHHFITLTITLGLGSGCLAIYTFDALPPASCQSMSDCPGSDACGQRVCEQGTCQIQNPVVAGGGPVLPDEPRGDCRRSTCDGQGNLVSELDDLDVPFDGNACVVGVCTNGVPSKFTAPAGTACGIAPTVECNATGQCAGCQIAADCGVDSDCVHWTCSNAICLRVLLPIGTLASDPVAGDCRKNLCNEIGESPSTFDASDAPSDGDSCTIDVCLPDGGVSHVAAPNGTRCGDCASCMAGICSPCDPAIFNCFNNECILKPKPCTQASDCASAYCVDGYCCNEECTGLCMACSEVKTGQPSGLCGPIVNGSDPDNECTIPNIDVCWNGVCRCQNGIQDGDETGVDCGGSCSPC